jgi:hypothetical protein
MMAGFFATNALAQKHLSVQQANVDCTLDGLAHTCNRADLQRAFAEAHTVAIESQPKDRVADAELASFTRKLAKELSPSASADITLRLVRTPSAGVSVGPSDVELATLRVFSTKSGPQDSRLLWVETYRGQPDLPWGAVVRALTGQLQATLAGR